MAENKQSFVLYTDLLKVVEKLVLQDRENKTNYSGELFYHILQYVNDQNPIPINFIIELAFEPIKCQLKRDLKKYKIIKERRSLAGKQGGRPKKETENSDEEKAKEAIALFDKQSKAKKAVNDTVTVNDTVNVNDIKREGEEENPPPENPIFDSFMKKFEMPLSECKVSFLEDELHIHRLKKQYGNDIPQWINKFFAQLELEGIETKTLMDAKSHFTRWYQIKSKEKTNEKSRRNLDTTKSHASEAL